MSIKNISLPRQIWYEEKECCLEFPDQWDVIPCLMEGHGVPKISPDDIRSALKTPTGSPPLTELAKGKNEVAIIFDDISRPTRAAEIVPHILDELHAAGIPDRAIRFVCATGCHGAHTYLDFQKKLGPKVMDNFPVYNHNVYENCTYVGETSLGTKLSVNSEVMGCDLKIAIGSVVPHPQTGFGGGGKIVLPGIASIDSIEAFHRLEFKAREEGKWGTVGPGNYADNPMVSDFTEAARLAGLDFKIDTLISGKGEPCAVFAGTPEAVYYQAVRLAVKHYATRSIPDADIVVVNTYAKGNEAIVGLLIGVPMLMTKGGDLVLIMDCPAGQVVHYLLGSFGTRVKGRLFSAVSYKLPWLKRVIVLCPQFERSTKDWLAIPDAVWVKTWEEVIDILRGDFPEKVKVAVVPDGTIQYLAPQQT